MTTDFGYRVMVIAGVDILFRYQILATVAVEVTLFITGRHWRYNWVALEVTLRITGWHWRYNWVALEV